MNSTADLFSPGEFRFHLTLRREQPADFFRSQDPTGRVLAERGHWIEHEPERHVQFRPGADAVVREFAAWAAEWGTPSGPLSSIDEIGRRFEPDILFLTADPAGQFRLQAGVVCFPSGWSLEEKIGHPLDFIHSAVPGLNAALGPSIHQFLSRLKPGAAFFRANWGLAGTDQLNLHPARQIAAPTTPVALDRLWLRVEEQILVALPETKGIVFGIRIDLRRLDQFAREAGPAGDLRHALATMPAEVAVYKRIEAIRRDVIHLLGPPDR